MLQHGGTQTVMRVHVCVTGVSNTLESVPLLVEPVTGRLPAVLKYWCTFEDQVTFLMREHYGSQLEGILVKLHCQPRCCGSTSVTICTASQYL